MLNSVTLIFGDYQTQPTVLEKKSNEIMDKAGSQKQSGIRRIATTLHLHVSYIVFPPGIQDHQKVRADRLLHSHRFSLGFPLVL